jgi:hypothetical protein
MGRSSAPPTAIIVAYTAAARDGYIVVTITTDGVTVTLIRISSVKAG